MVNKHVIFLFVLTGAIVVSCATHKKLTNIQRGNAPEVQLSLANEESFVPDINTGSAVTKDTLKVYDDDGKEFLFMKAAQTESGETVASDVLEAATVEARFRNIAERNGEVDLAFKVTVPQTMMDSKWQLRFNPDMYILGDSVRLDPIIITGQAYRKAQLKGYQQYNRFLSRIVKDTTKFINIPMLEIFLKRNIPELYAFRTDSTWVTDEQFCSVYGVNQQQAVEHYTNKFAKRRNERRIARREAMYRKYVKAPIVTEGIRLDSIVTNPQGDFIYNYVQTIHTRPKLRKVDIVLSGHIYEKDQVLYDVPRAKPLTFYISSISSFVDDTERYLTKVVERRASANTQCRIDFKVAKTDVDTSIGENAVEIGRIRKTLASLVQDEEFDLDSIVVCANASPEGSYKLNQSLAQRRSESVSHYFDAFVQEHIDSLKAEEGFSLNMDSTFAAVQQKTYQPIKFTPRSVPENWEDLYALVADDKVLNDGDKVSFFKTCDEKNPDLRDQKLKTKPYYKYVKGTLYPKLRTVKFNFYLHRKGMVKDTVHTTVIDSVYMKGVQALRDMDYESAIKILAPYKDYNAAVAFMGCDRNRNALNILKKMEKTDEVNYLMAILYSRMGRVQEAVQCYVTSCKQNHSFVYRGNLDPEISVLIKTYGLNQEEEDEFADLY